MHQRSIGWLVRAFVVCLADVTMAQEQPASRPTVTIHLPLASEVKPGPVPEGAIVVEIFHRASKSETCPNAADLGLCKNAKHWIARIGDAEAAFEPNGAKWLRDKLAPLSGLSKTSKSAKSESELLIRSDGAAPWGSVRDVVAAAATAKIWRISFAAHADATGAEGWLETPLPVDSPNGGKHDDEVRVAMSFDVTKSLLMRFITSPAPRPVEAGATGDALIERLLKEHCVTRKKEDRPPAPLIIDAGPPTRIQDIVTIINLGRKSGMNRVEFGRASTMKQNPSARPSEKKND